MVYIDFTYPPVIPNDEIVVKSLTSNVLTPASSIQVIQPTNLTNNGAAPPSPTPTTPTQNEKFIIKNRNPTPNENLPIGTIWVNKLSGELFVCIDDTKDSNKWVGSQGTIIAPPLYYPVDIFGDNSIIAFYRFNNSTNDESGLFHGEKIGDTKYTTGIFDYALDFGKVPNNKNAFIVRNIELSDSINFSFWVYKYYDNQINPYISLSYRDIYNAILFFEFAEQVRIILDNKFYTFPNAKTFPTYEWIFISLNISNKDKRVELFVHGEFVDEITITNELLLKSYSFNNCLIFGQDQDTYCGGFDVTQSFLGKLDHFRIFRRALSSEEVKKLYKEKER